MPEGSGRLNRNVFCHLRNGINHFRDGSSHLRGLTLLQIIILIIKGVFLPKVFTEDCEIFTEEFEIFGNRIGFLIDFCYRIPLPKNPLPIGNKMS